VSSPQPPSPVEHGGRRTLGRTIALHGEQVSFWESTPAHEVPPSTPTGGEAQPPRSRPGEIVVLVHGFAGSAHTWEPVLAELARRRDPRHIIIPDLVGHGSSAAPWADYSLGSYATGIRDLLAALGHDHATIVGHSLGGGVVQQFAWQFPQHCDRLVLVDTGGLGREVNPVMRAATLPGADWVLPLMIDPRVVGVVDALAHRAHRVLPRLSGSTLEAARSFASLTDPVHRRAFLHTVRSVIDWGGQRVNASSRLYLLEGLPTLIIWGTADTMIPVEHAHRAHDLIPGSRLELIDGAGHFPHHDQPERFTELLTDFLDQTQPAQRTTAEQGAQIAARTNPPEPSPASEHRKQQPGAS
jgi:pimeloyl-ACP methyl ester carboxylesterase